MVEHIAETILGGLVALFGFFIKGLHSKTERVSNDLHEHKTHVALHYTTKDSVEKHFDKVDMHLQKIHDKLDDMKG